jgi:hypothetical protein
VAKEASRPSAAPVWPIPWQGRAETCKHGRHIQRKNPKATNAVLRAVQRNAAHSPRRRVAIARPREPVVPSSNAFAASQLHAACCLRVCCPHVACCTLHVVSVNVVCMLHGVRCMLSPCMLSACCMVCVACCLRVCCLHVACCMLHAVRPDLQVRIRRHRLRHQARAARREPCVAARFVWSGSSGRVAGSPTGPSPVPRKVELVDL